MKSGFALLSALLLISAGRVDGKKFSCSSKGRTLTQFAGTTEQVTMPCKFNAVYQQCGDYLVTVTPGQRYLPPWYIISSLHVSVKDAATSALLWEGRTDYKVGAKYLYEFKKVDENGKTVLRQPAPFAKIDGSKETEELFSFSKTRKEVKIAEKKGAFHVSFGPYDPEEGFKSSSWEFACFGPGKMQLTQYPTQICGDGIAARRDELGFKDKIQAFFYDVFTNRDIAQTNPKCKEATDIMTKDCSDEGKKDAITRCYKIMDSDAHAKCANKFSCDIMDVFVDCVRFVCSSFSDTAACNRIGSSIDLCREFPGLSDKVDEANCYKDFVYRP